MEAEEETLEEEATAQQIVSECCGTPIVEVKTPIGVRYKCSQCGKMAKPVRKGEERAPLKPPEVEMTETVVNELAVKLPTVYGISKSKALAIVDTVRGNPNIALNPMNLFMHITQMEPRINTYHLWTIISGIFQELRTAGWTGAIPTFQTVQQMAYQQPWMYGWQWQQQPYMFGQAAPSPSYEPPRMRPPSMKVVVEGQEIETDLAGFMAWRRWESERKRDEEERREHELRLKKLEAEIKEIESRASSVKGPGRAEEERVEVEVEGQKFRVPASLAPLYMSLRRPQESEDAKRMQEEIEKLRDELHKKDVESLQHQLTEIAQKLESQPSFWEQLEAFEGMSERLGYKRSGRTALDVLDSLGERLDQRAQQLIAKVGVSSGEFKPEVKRTVEEREKEVKKLEQKLARSKEILEAENELLKAAARVK